MSNVVPVSFDGSEQAQLNNWAREIVRKVPDGGFIVPTAESMVQTFRRLTKAGEFEAFSHQGKTAFRPAPNAEAGE